MKTPHIFVAGDAIWGPFHQQVVSALQAAGADVYLYEWSSLEEPLSQEVEQALWLRPITLLTVTAPHLDPNINQSNMPRILRGGKIITLVNPARLVLPLPIESIPTEQWQHDFGFTSPFGEHTASSPMELIDRTLVLTALRPQPSLEAVSPETQFLIGQALLSHQRFEEALAWIKPLLQASSPPHGVRAAIAYGSAQLQRWAECVVMGETALNQGDGLTAPFYALGLGFNGLGRYADAEMAFHRALSTQPDLSGAWVGLSKALLHLDRAQEALPAFERGLSAATKHVWNAWAYEDPVVAIEAQRLLAQVRQRLAEPPSSTA